MKLGVVCEGGANRTIFSCGVLDVFLEENLLPDYFSFVKGLVDSQDLSLNISREMLQHDRQLKLIAGRLEKKIASELKSMLTNDREKYEEFWKSFGLQLKFGMYDGYRGLIENDHQFMRPQDFSGIISTGGTILGTSRQPFIPGKAIVDKDGNDVMPSMLDTYNRLNLDCLVVLGGNGTQKSAKLLQDAGMNIITLPKTIDNDIYGTDETFGFQSAADIATNVIDYIHTTALAHSRIFMVEVMGRDAGWLTLYSGIAGGADVILIPEIPYDIQSIAQTIERRKRGGRTFSIIAVAEGAISKEDKVLSEEERRRVKDANPYSTISYQIAAQLKELTGQEARVTVPGHYQRGGQACPYDRVLATRFGVAAARLIMEQKYGYMVGIQEGNIVFPKTTNPEHMEQNIDIFDFSLSDEDMAAIATLDTGKSLFFDHHDAETARMFMGWR